MVRCGVFGAIGAGVVGGMVGFTVGMAANPPTAWFAILEVGVPAALVGEAVGLVVGLGIRSARGVRPR